MSWVANWCSRSNNFVLLFNFVSFSLDKAIDNKDFYRDEKKNRCPIFLRNPWHRGGNPTFLITFKKIGLMGYGDYYENAYYSIVFWGPFHSTLFHLDPNEKKIINSYIFLLPFCLRINYLDFFTVTFLSHIKWINVWSGS